MFNNDDYFEDSPENLDELLGRYEQIKNGVSSGIMDEDDFEIVIEHFYHTNSEEQALLAADIARTYYPFSTGIMLLKAEILAQAKKYGQALKILDEVDNYDINNIDAVLMRSDIMVGQLKYDQAALWLEKQSENFKGKDKTELLHELSDVYDECEEYDAVFDTLTRIIKTDKRNEEALQKICFWAEFADRLEDSVLLHTRLTDADPYNALAWFNLGAAYQGLKLYEKAIDAYEFCLAIDELFEFAYRNIADAYMRLKDYLRAIEALEKHLEIAKPEDVIYEAIGFCWEKRKDFTKARQFYRLASALSPQDDSIFFKIGETYARERLWDKAVKAYSVALSLDKENANYCLAIGNCLMNLDVTNEALICYKKAVRLKPGNKGTWVALIKGLYFAKKYDEALKSVYEAREKCGVKSEFTYLAAACLFELGKTKEGALILEQALKDAPAKIKIFTEMNPENIRRATVTDLITKYKKSRKKP